MQIRRGIKPNGDDFEITNSLRAVQIRRGIKHIKSELETWKV